ncbi:mucin-2-like [Salvia hispanica]|uniref:mucin-2-like n=1 Tax=Salvia hispanica TaxID=49212 RepID=UPI002009A7CC|nr:mucin-2-like [Salvia hispanica]
MAKKKATSIPASTTGDNPPEVRATAETRPPSPQRSQPTPTPQIPAMVPLDALAAYLKQQDPNKDWTTTLAGFSLAGGMSAIPNPTQTATTMNPPMTTPTTSNPTSEKTSPTATAPSEPSNPSPKHQQTEPLDVNPLSAYQDPN